MKNPLFVLPAGASHTSKLLDYLMRSYGDQYKLDIMYYTGALSATKNSLLNDKLSDFPGARFYYNWPNALYKRPDTVFDVSQYDRIVFESLNIDNCRFVDTLFPAHKIDVLTTDDEIHRRYLFMSFMENESFREEELRYKLLFNKALEAAFEKSINFIGPSFPWKGLLTYKRLSPVIWHDIAIPWQLRPVQFVPDVTPNSEEFKILLFPKFVSLEGILAALELVSSFSRDYMHISFSVYIVTTLKTDRQKICAYESENLRILTFDAPMHERVFWAIAMSCDGVCLNERGGAGAIFQMARNGKMIIDLGFFSYNKQQLGWYGIKVLDIGGVRSFLDKTTDFKQIAEHNAVNIENKLNEGRDFLLKRYFTAA